MTKITVTHRRNDYIIVANNYYKIKLRVFVSPCWSSNKIKTYEILEER